MLQMVEQGKPLKYVLMGSFTKPDLEIFWHGADIPDLGKASSESAGGCNWFLVSSSDLQIAVRPEKTAEGVEFFPVDQLVNPDTVELNPGGIWKADILLEGRVATVSSSPASQELMKLFQKAIKKHFTKIRAFYVGPEAHSMLKAGKRLTIAEQSPREFDLAPLP